MVVICISTWSSIYFVDDNVQDAPSRAPTYTGVENSCHVCHAFHLPAPQLSPVVKFFSHLSHFSPSLSTPLFPLHRNTEPTVKGVREE